LSYPDRRRLDLHPIAHPQSFAYLLLQQIRESQTACKNWAIQRPSLDWTRSTAAMDAGWRQEERKTPQICHHFWQVRAL